MISAQGLSERAKYYLSFISTDLAAAYLKVPRLEPLAHSASLEAAIDWICRAQDAFPDGGVARSYSVVFNGFFKRRGWIPSYPETTGYIIPTMFDYAAKTGRSDVVERAVRMADWECEVQMDNGAVQGGTIDEPPTPAVFNTGQVIFGWVRAYRETGNQRYLASAVRAGDFLLSVMEADGSWRKSLSQYASGSMSSYTYNTRTAWAILQLADASNRPTYREAAVRNVDFALRGQLSNGWFPNNCLSDSARPLVHTIAYSLRGILEVGLATENKAYVAAVRKAADAMLAKQRQDGSLAGRFDSQWQPAVDWSCLTGNAQMGLVWGRLHQATGEDRYLTGLSKANRYLRTVQWSHTRNPGLDGGISGSFPFHGRYGRFEVLNWAAKFFADSLMLEESIGRQTR